MELERTESESKNDSFQEVERFQPHSMPDTHVNPHTQTHTHSASHNHSLTNTNTHSLCITQSLSHAHKHTHRGEERCIIPGDVCLFEQMVAVIMNMIGWS